MPREFSSATKNDERRTPIEHAVAIQTLLLMIAMTQQKKKLSLAPHK
jgi:hypothetical protein